MKAESERNNEEHEHNEELRERFKDICEHHNVDTKFWKLA